MNIFLIIFGAIIFLMFGVVYLSTHTVTKSQENWDDFYKAVEERNLAIPEEYTYELVCKIRFWTGVGTILGLVALVGGILLQIFTK